MAPSLARSHNGVALIGEALGEHEAKSGSAFVGPAGFKLTRLIEWAGFDRGNFDIYNAVWCRPPANKLENQPYEFGSINHCKEAHWSRLIERSRVLVPMGNVPLGALVGHKGILQARGYVREGWGRQIVPTVHPSFIQRGNSNFGAVFINDLRKAVEVAALPESEIIERQRRCSAGFLLDPPPEAALRWANEVLALLANAQAHYLSYDIETPWKDEDESEADDEDESVEDNAILRVGFSVGPRTLSIPWSGEYLPTIHALLESRHDKVVWNTGFDTPRIRGRGVSINGNIHDGMIAWHVLHSDLPKGLAFVATFTTPFQPAWKHLNSQQPAFYNATDAKVEVDSMEVIEASLKREGMWDTYCSDVLELEPILAYMNQMGMPIDNAVREDRAARLAEKQHEVLGRLEDLFPDDARKVAHVYKNPPKDTTGLRSRPAVVEERICSICGAVKPTKAHFRVLKKRKNPCDSGTAIRATRDGLQWYRVAPFRPSKQQLMAYQAALGRLVPGQWNSKEGKRKPSMNEKAIKLLMGKYPDDKFYPLVLEYRELDKLAGTYIGRPANEESE